MSHLLVKFMTTFQTKKAYETLHDVHLQGVYREVCVKNLGVVPQGHKSYWRRTKHTRYAFAGRGWFVVWDVSQPPSPLGQLQLRVRSLPLRKQRRGRELPER